jgi:dTDP-4-dehydrorhamnose 3,5-epimerase
MTQPATVHPSSITRAIQFTESKLSGCFIVQFPIAQDYRGHFVKTIQRSVLEAYGLEADFKECFYSTSFANVLRGMHFQTPPMDHAKLVYCTVGSIYDVALDLRIGSPTYGKHEVYELSSGASNAVYLPRGIAHGFYVREGPAVMVYHVTSEHDAMHDNGIRWDSFGAAWPTDSPVISTRDMGFPCLQEFESPFVYRSTGNRESTKP